MQGVHRVWAKVGAFGSLGDCCPDLCFERAWFPALSVFDEKQRRTGVLADGGLVAPAHFHIFEDRNHGSFCRGTLIFSLAGIDERVLDGFWQVG